MGFRVPGQTVSTAHAGLSVPDGNGSITRRLGPLQAVPGNERQSLRDPGDILVPGQEAGFPSASFLWQEVGHAYVKFEKA